MFSVDWVNLGIGGGIVFLSVLVVVAIKKLAKNRNKDRENMLQNIVDSARGISTQQPQQVQEVKSTMIQLDLNPIIDTEKRIGILVNDIQEAVKEIQNNILIINMEQKKFTDKMYDYIIPLLKEDLDESIKKKKSKG